MKRRVLVSLSMGWYGGLITRKSQERTKDLYDYRVHLEEEQSVRSLKLLLGEYRTFRGSTGRPSGPTALRFVIARIASSTSCLDGTSSSGLHWGQTLISSVIVGSRVGDLGFSSL